MTWSRRPVAYCAVAAATAPATSAIHPTSRSARQQAIPNVQKNHRPMMRMSRPSSPGPATGNVPRSAASPRRPPPRIGAGAGLARSRVHARRFVAGALDVLDVGALIRVRLRLGAALTAKLQHAVAQAAQEFAIVGHE